MTFSDGRIKPATGPCVIVDSGIVPAITCDCLRVSESGGLGPDSGRMGTRRTKAPNVVHVLSIAIAFILEGEPLQQEGRRRSSWIFKMAAV